MVKQVLIIGAAGLGAIYLFQKYGKKTPCGCAGEKKTAEAAPAATPPAEILPDGVVQRFSTNANDFFRSPEANRERWMAIGAGLIDTVAF